ncbi:MAG: branched-chain amino acid ABC transporter permease [Hyphomicrobiaceae bacterium]
MTAPTTQAKPDASVTPEAGLAQSAGERAHTHERAEWRGLRIAAFVFFASAVLFGLIFWMQGDKFYLRLATEALIFGGMALSVDILLGFGGLLSLGQALFFGLGAYTSALVLKEVAPSFWLAVGASVVMGVVSGLIGGLIAIRVKGVYFALITFGLAQVVSKVIYNTRELGASDGIIGIPIITVPLGATEVRTDSPIGFFLVVLTALLLVYLALGYLSNTPFGRALSGVRINEHRLAFLGYRPNAIKLGAFVLAAVVASLCGGLYPMLRGFVSPELMFFDASTNAVVAVVIGGAGTLIGPLVGAILLTYVRSAVGTFTEHHLIVIGSLFIIVVLFFPRGLLGFVRDRYAAAVRAKSKGPKP